MERITKQAKESSSSEILLEYANLRQPESCPQGVYVSLSQSDSHLWHCVIFLRRGPYTGGIFRFNIQFPLNYPSSSPSASFPSTLFHPLISSQSGLLSLTPRFPQGWIPRQHTISHLLYYIKSIFSTKVLEELREGQVFNQEVWRMYRENNGLFRKLAGQSSSLSVSESSLFEMEGGGNPGNGRDGGGMVREGAEEDGIRFKILGEEEMKGIRRELFGDEVEGEER